MEFRGNRDNQNVRPQLGTQPAPTPIGTPGNFQQPSKVQKPLRRNSKLLKIGGIILLFAIAILLILMLLLSVFSDHSAFKTVKKDNYQAVFLNNGQVYFGKINSIGNHSIDLRGIYYLQTSATTSTDKTAAANSNVSLVKLGCELHAPFDQMIINSEQVIFWENIQDTSQVVKAIKTSASKSSDQQCSQTSQSSTQQSPSTSTPSTTTPSIPGSSSTTKP